MEKIEIFCAALPGLADILQVTQRSRAGLNNFALRAGDLRLSPYDGVSEFSPSAWHPIPSQRDRVIHIPT